MATFADLGLSKPLLDAIEHLGYKQPTPIQEQTIPALLEGKDVMGQAQTGTGKTAAFGLPLLQFVDPENPEVQALVLTPTRELCIQVTQALRAYGAAKGIEHATWREIGIPADVLRDAITHMLADDPTLEPRDIVVMCPDIDAYAPLIQAGFGLDGLEDAFAAMRRGEGVRSVIGFG